MFHNIKISHRIVIATIIPIIGLMAFAGISLKEKVRTLRDMEAIKSTVQLSSQARDVIHDLQKERGMSAGYLASDGRNFVDQLKKQRNETDETLKILRNALNKFQTTNERSEISTMIMATVGGLADATEKRKEVDARMITVDTEVAFYTDKINRLLYLISSMAKYSHDPKISNAISAFVSLLQVKEKSGLERAMGSVVFGGNTNKLFRIRFVDLIRKQNDFYAVFTHLARSDVWSFAQETLSSPAVQEVDRLRDVIIRSLHDDQSGEVGILSSGIDATYWFTTITTKINLLKAISDRSASELMAKATTARDSALHALTITTLLVVGCLATIILVSAVIVESVTTPLRNLLGATKVLSNGNNTDPIVWSKGENEISHLFENIEVFRQRLVAGDSAIEETRILSKAVEQSPVAAIIMNADGKIKYVNSTFVALTGYRPKDVIGSNYQILKSTQTSDDIFSYMWDTVSNGEDWRGEFSNTTKDGNYFWVQVSVSPIRDDNGKTTHYVAVEEDISLRKEQESLQIAKDAAERANMAKSEFLANMSHELRTPMNAILGFAQLLQFNRKEPLTELQNGCVDSIVSGGDHLLDLINEVLDLAKIESGNLNCSVESVSIKEVVTDCLTLVDTLAEKRDIEISTEGLDEVTDNILADHTRLKQVTLNLLSNAIKYNREGGKVLISSRKTPTGMMRLIVSDTGMGIPNDKKDDLFKPFSRLGAEMTETEGTGIGLTVTKQLVEHMNGEIGFESEASKGSTFWVELPLAGAFEQIEAQVGHVDSLYHGEIGEISEIKGKVLYVEDNPANIKLMEMTLAPMMDLELITVHTAELGIEFAESQKPEVIIMDINLPGMDGFKALRALQSSTLTHDIPVIALTANAMQGSLERGLRAGFYAYITKPLNVKEFLHTLHKAIGRSHWQAA